MELLILEIGLKIKSPSFFGDSFSIDVKEDYIKANNITTVKTSPTNQSAFVEPGTALNMGFSLENTSLESPKELTTTVPDNYVLKGDSIGSYTAKNTAEGQQVYLSNDLYFNSDGTLCDISLNTPSIFQSQIQDDNNLLIDVGMF